MIVIALSGLARAGKDSVADVLVKDFGFEKRSFAAPLKEMARKLNPIIGWDLYNPGRQILLNEALERYGEDSVKQIFPEYRRLLQVLGTDCIRSLAPNFWVDAAKASLTDPNGRYVFTDCRFPNEAEMVIALNDQPEPCPVFGESCEHPGDHVGAVWQVSRPGIELSEDAHESERHVGLMGEEYQIINDGTLEDLAEAVAVGLGFATGFEYEEIKASVSVAPVGTPFDGEGWTEIGTTTIEELTNEPG